MDRTLESLEITVCDHGATIADGQCRHRLLVFLRKATTGGASITKLAVGNLEGCKRIDIDGRSDLEAFDVNGGGAIVDFEHAREGGSGARHQPDLARSGLGTPVARDVVSATDKKRERGLAVCFSQDLDQVILGTDDSIDNRRRWRRRR